MKFSLASLRSATGVEVALLVLLAAFVVLPVKVPTAAATVINAPLGMLALFCTAVFLFVYSRPLLGIVFVFVAYELLRRSAIDVAATPRTDLVQFTQTAATAEQRNLELQRMQPPARTTLEEEVIASMAPVATGSAAAYLATAFKPVSTNLHNAFPI